MDAHVLMYYIALTLGHMWVTGGFNVIIKHCIPSLPFSVYYININFCHALSFPDPLHFEQEIGRVCNKGLREAWE